MGAPATGANGRCHEVAKQNSPELKTQRREDKTGIAAKTCRAIGLAEAERHKKRKKGRAKISARRGFC